MPQTPQGAYSPTDDDLDSIVNEALSEGGEAPTTAPDPAPSAPTGENPVDTAPDAVTGNADGGAHDEDDEPERQPASDAAPETPPAAETPAPPTAPPGSKPFQFKAAGGEHVLPGASELPDGSVAIAKDALPDFRRTLASAVELQRNFTTFRRNHQRELDRLKAERTDKDIEADSISQLFGELKKMSPEERWVFFQRFEEETPKLEVAIEQKKLEREREALKREREGPVLSDEEKQEQAQTLATNELNVTFKTLAQHEDAKLFTRDELEKLYAKWRTRATRLMRTAAEDGDGWKKGQTVFDDTEVWEDFNLLADVKKRTAAKAGPTGAAARNAALNADQQAGNKIPPSVQPARPAGGDGRKKSPSFAGNKKGFQKAFMAGDLDDTED